VTLVRPGANLMGHARWSAGHCRHEQLRHCTMACPFRSLQLETRYGRRRRRGAGLRDWKNTDNLINIRAPGCGACRTDGRHLDGSEAGSSRVDGVPRRRSRRFQAVGLRRPLQPNQSVTQAEPARLVRPSYECSAPDARPLHSPSSGARATRRSSREGR
jgi:hypothetical protein